MRLYETIQKLRKDAGYSQEQLAEKLGVSRQAVSKWENGMASPGVERLQEICTVLGVSMAEVLGADTKPSDIERIQLYEEEITKLKNQKQFQKLLILGIATSALILLFLFVTLFRRIDLMNNHIQQWDGQVGQIYSNVDQQIGQMKSQFSSMLEQQESLVAEYSIDAKDLIVKDGQLNLTLRCTPKNYREEMTAEFVINGKRSYSALAIFEKGSYYANIPVDITENDLSFMVRFTKEGDTATQFLDSHSNLINDYLMKIGAENNLKFYNNKVGLSIQGVVTTIYSPRYDNSENNQMTPKLINYPISGEVIFEKAGEVVIQNKIDLINIDLEGGEYSECQVDTQINETIKDYNPGDEIQVIIRLKDNLGNIRELEVCNYKGL